MLGDKMPFGVGVIFGCVELALERVDVKESVDNLCQDVLRDAVDFLGVLEAGRDTLAGRRLDNRPEYQKGITDAIVLCCTSKRWVPQLSW